jgi:hypothetical protein
VKASVSDPEKFVMDDVKGFLAACLADPGASGRIVYYSGLGNFLAELLAPDRVNFPQTDPARLHALRIGKSLADGDPEFLAIAAKYENEYGEIGEVARSVRAASGDYSELQDRVRDFNGNPPAATVPGHFSIVGDPRSNLPGELSDAIQDAEHPDKMMPLIEAALASPDRQMRFAVARALYFRAGKNGWGSDGRNQLGNQFYPLMVRLLRDPDREIQYEAMGCIFSMSGEVRKRPDEREINLWATDIVAADPDKYVAQYEDWWAKHKGKFGY